MSDPSRRDLYRFLFELYGQALGEPDKIASFLKRVVEDWLRVLADDAADPEAARAQATLGLAVTRGLTLDLVTTTDSERVTKRWSCSWNT